MVPRHSYGHDAAHAFHGGDLRMAGTLMTASQASGLCTRKVRARWSYSFD